MATLRGCLVWLLFVVCYAFRWFRIQEGTVLKESYDYLGIGVQGEASPFVVDSESKSLLEARSKLKDHPKKKTTAVSENKTSSTISQNISQQPQAPKKVDNRPVLVLHIGPHKTATSTIQCELTYFGSLLQRSGNYTYLGRIYGECQGKRSQQPKYAEIDTRAIVRCLDQHSQDHPCDQTEEWKTFSKTLSKVAHANQNAVISDEAFSRTKLNDHNLELLFQTIGPYFRLRLVLVYRHYFSWLLSQYNEHFKPLPRRSHYQTWPDEKGGKPIQPFVEYYTNYKVQVQKRHYQSAASKGNYQEAADILDLHPVAYLQKQWTNPRIPGAPKDVVVVNLHKEGDIIVNFVGQALSETVAMELERQKEKLARKGSTIPTRENPSLNLDFDMLAVEARKQGLFPNHEKLYRRGVARYIETLFQKYEAAIPQFQWICPKEAQFQQFANRSLLLEETVFGAEYAQRVQHQADFAEDKGRNKFCNLDVQQLLKAEVVQKMFRSLEVVLRSEQLD